MKNLSNQWDHLPNAAHIDRVIKSVKSHSEVWNQAWSAARYTARIAARDAARIAARAATRAVAWSAASAAAMDAVTALVAYDHWAATGVAAKNSARDAVSALIAYDHAAQYLEMPSEKVQVWAALSEDPAAILMLPAVIAFEQIDNKELIV